MSPPFPSPTVPAAGPAEVCPRHMGHLDIVAELAGGPVGE